MKSHEIGSEFWNIPLTDDPHASVFPRYVSWYLSGGSAIQAIILDIRRHRTLNSVALPSWCCESMIRPFLACNVAVSFYPVTYSEGGEIHADFSGVSDCDALLVMDYFGYRREWNIPSFGGEVIRDLTHSIFCGTYSDADYYFGSLRKWAGFWTGGFAWKRDGAGLPELEEHIDAGRYTALRRQAMRSKENYLMGSSESKQYLEIFGQAEELLERGCMGAAVQRDIQAALDLDISLIRMQRRKNAAFLLEAVAEAALFPKLEERDCPLFVPVYLPAEQRDKLRQYLIRRDIYCPIHWPVSSAHRLDRQTGRLFDGELSLVCDQRYTTEELAAEREAVLEFFNEEYAL